jgi:competence protein ComEC
MRELISRAEKVRVQFVIPYSPSRGSAEKYIKWKYLQIFIPKGYQIVAGNEVEIIGTIDKSVQENSKQEITLINTTFKTKRAYTSFGFFSLSSLHHHTQELCFQITDRVRRFLPEPHASLVLGIVLGYQGSLPGKFKQDLITTGLIHVVAASGSNVSMMGVIVMSVCARVFSKRTALMLSIIGIAFYAFLAGASPPVIRSSIMAILAIVGLLFGKESKAGYILWVSALLMLIQDPFLLFSISFQLSFASTVGIIYFYPLLRGKDTTSSSDHQFHLFNALSILQENLFTTISAFLFTFPLLLKHFERLSLITIVANTAVVWLVTYMYTLGLIYIFLVALLPPLVGALTSPFVWGLYEVFVVSINLFSSFPYASVEIGHTSWIGVFLAYFSLVGWGIWRVGRVNGGVISSSNRE